MKRAYRTLLRLYPRDYQARFSAEMLDAFEQTDPGFVPVELLGLLLGAAREWSAKLSTSPSIRGRTLPDLRMMRPPGVPRELWFAHAKHDRCS
jgi:hypothetical protein